MSSIRSLSAEILGNIFEMCIIGDRENTMNSGRAPLLLCQICHAWRNIAINKPSLWTSSTIDLRPRRLNSVLNYTNFAHIIMQRIQKKSLALRFAVAGVQVKYPSTASLSSQLEISTHMALFF
ncbi:hypothetical protein CPB84DRAFT_329404 [Gymnopilus junonius]|uniref:F-box domain-containing protein n=1 Tax=Gymnopilus junonius TaxID=109634 RepID=A0A9P5NEA7_GYMJU|nr:hypothetical protein CPB84DRAFT_329404 [Gymnopilus junonius]